MEKSKIKLLAFLLLITILPIACNSGDDPPDVDCVFFSELLDMPEEFEECPTDGTANLCGNIGCNIFDLEATSPDTFVRSGQCIALDCFTMTCVLRDIEDNSIIGDVTLTIEEFISLDQDLFTGVATIEGDPESSPYFCGSIID